MLCLICVVSLLLSFCFLCVFCQCNCNMQPATCNLQLYLYLYLCVHAAELAAAACHATLLKGASAAL